MTETETTTNLVAGWADAKAADPFARARDVANRLGVSEGALVDARCGAGVTRLRGTGPALSTLIASLPRLGRVMTLTRNEAAVHETKGQAGATANFGAMGQVTGAIDLRLFYRHLHVAYEVQEETRSGLRRSFQMFDGAGDSVLKIYALDETDGVEWDRVLAAHAAADHAAATFGPRKPEPADRPDAEIDVDALHAGWRALDHTHDFHRLLGELHVGREQALRLAEDGLARRAAPGAARRLLDEAAALGVPIMCFVGNPGCIQIYSGTIHQIKEMGPWLNVLDADFNLHLRADQIAAAWLVTKPTRLHGPITSLEFYDAERRLILQVFGVRPGDGSEREDWRALAHRVAEASA